MFYCKMTGNVYMRKSFTNNFVAKEILNFTATSLHVNFKTAQIETIFHCKIN